ncbi:GNAT family N-acetyltransferase [Litorisediminicola beolgyonensis]|uniref:L-ornithine N(alpha)-acyltransferase n=1 Tax=Litorisediminicola beolgyonensis TaxID=1173614 RepID=A0ABW3ZDM7_9RHOB
MSLTPPEFTVDLARSDDEIRAAQRLRYEVFVEELGASGEGVDHARRLEADRFDAHVDHLLLRDVSRADAPVVGVYRLLREDAAREIGQFYSEDEYDLAPLRSSGRRLLELGRSCVHRDYRGGPGLMRLWQGLSDYVAAHEIELLFGVASFHGTDVKELAAPLSLLHHRHLAPEPLRVRSRVHQPMALCPEDGLDRLEAARAIPALIKSYLRLGAVVGDGAFLDHAFNTTDICLVIDTARLDPRQGALYRREAS